MTVHSGIFGPVHTGIVSGIEFFGALRLQRRLELCSTTTATGPSSCVPPPCGTTAPPKSAAPPSPRTCVIVLSPQVVLTPSLDCRPGLFQALPSSGILSFTLHHRVHVPGPRAGPPRGDFLPVPGPLGGFQAAATRLLDDPKSKVYRFVISGTTDALQLNNSSRFFNAPNSRVHPERKRHGSGCDPCSTPSQEGLTDTRR